MREDGKRGREMMQGLLSVKAYNWVLDEKAFQNLRAMVAETAKTVRRDMDAIENGAGDQETAIEVFGGVSKAVSASASSTDSKLPTNVKNPSAKQKRMEASADASASKIMRFMAPKAPGICR